MHLLKKYRETFCILFDSGPSQILMKSPQGKMVLGRSVPKPKTDAIVDYQDIHSLTISLKEECDSKKKYTSNLIK